MDRGEYTTLVALRRRFAGRCQKIARIDRDNDFAPADHNANSSLQYDSRRRTNEGGAAKELEHPVAQYDGSGSMQGNQGMTGLTVRGSIVDFALLIGGAFATACAVGVVAMGVVLLVVR